MQKERYYIAKLHLQDSVKEEVRLFIRHEDADNIFLTLQFLSSSRKVEKESYSFISCLEKVLVELDRDY